MDFNVHVYEMIIGLLFDRFSIDYLCQYVNESLIVFFLRFFYRKLVKKFTFENKKKEKKTAHEENELANERTTHVMNVKLLEIVC